MELLPQNRPEVITMDSPWNGLLRFAVRNYRFRKGRWRVINFARRFLRGVVLSKTDYGSRMLLDLDNCLDGDIYLGLYERQALAQLLAYSKAKQCHSFIDIGANIGLFSISFARQSHIERVHAFEPDPHNYAQCMANLFLSGYQHKVSVRAAGLSDHDGTANLYLARQYFACDFGKRNNGTTSLVFSEGRHSERDTVEVRIHRLDDLLPNVGETLTVKINVEGHELAVLRGMGEILRRNDCVLQVETWAGKCEPLDTFLGPLGYRQSRAPIEDNYFYLKEDARRGNGGHP